MQRGEKKSMCPYRNSYDVVHWIECSSSLRTGHVSTWASFMIRDTILSLLGWNASYMARALKQQWRTPLYLCHSYRKWWYSLWSTGEHLKYFVSQIRWWSYSMLCSWWAEPTWAIVSIEVKVHKERVDLSDLYFRLIHFYLWPPG